MVGGAAARKGAVGRDLGVSEAQTPGDCRRIRIEERRARLSVVKGVVGGRPWVGD